MKVYNQLKEVFSGLSFNREEISYPEVFELFQKRDVVPRIFSYRVFYSVFAKMVTIYVKSKIEKIAEKGDALDTKAFFMDNLTCAALLIIDHHLFVHLVMFLALFVPYPKKSANFEERIDAFVDYFIHGFKNKDFS